MLADNGCLPVTDTDSQFAATVVRIRTGGVDDTAPAARHGNRGFNCVDVLILYRMSTNVGSTESLVRVLIGAVVGTVAVATVAGIGPLPTVVAPVAGLLSIVLLVTGATSSCGLYSALGIDTSGAGRRS